ncbi:MAG: alpha/beta fold hydrolase [Lachnospiraceae bacterium]
MKKADSVLAGVLAACVAAGLCACGSTTSSDTAASTSTEASTATQGSDTASTEAVTESASADETSNEAATEGGTESLPAGMEGMPAMMGAGQESTEDLITPTYENVAYASVSDSEVCNIYLPEDATEGETYPVIVLVHGGGFAFETQNEALIQPVIQKGLDEGYAVVSVDYRKSSEAVFPAALSDVKAAVRYVRANADTYGFDTDNITIWGESAGAWLSLMTALTPDVAELDGDVTDNSEYSSAVNNLVDFYGPVEFYTMDEEFEALGKDDDATHSAADSFESQFLGQALSADKETTYKTYWETYKDQLPDDFTLRAWIQAGTDDDNVPYTQSENFAERLSDVIGSDNVSFSLIDGAAHMDPAFYTDENLTAVFDFLQGTSTSSTSNS